ncbi:MAG: hypothetical protein COB67_02600 [SAR324 cluster bacterium]|uniref:Uncharacterized protein n=1 Tax=SAR324 cluster bacterium TaxID=2024889 RepID=A0A2A4TAP1_9DELT|nr:MAG: hypothetical protein COB67_02600 [SAR324 cluster bacterium]
MTTEDGFNILLVAIIAIAAYYIYTEFIKKFTPEELGQENFDDICKFASPEWVAKAKSKGLTRQAWLNEIEKQEHV